MYFKKKMTSSQTNECVNITKVEGGFEIVPHTHVPYATVEHGCFLTFKKKKKVVLRNGLQTLC